MSGSYPRDLIGYGGSPPDPQWPGGASIAGLSNSAAPLDEPNDHYYLWYLWRPLLMGRDRP